MVELCLLHKNRRIVFTLSTLNDVGPQRMVELFTLSTLNDVEPH